MKCTIISSNGDLGHKFIQNGVMFALNNFCHHQGINVEIVDKHAHLDSENYFEDATSILLGSDLIIFAAGPAIWPFVERADWANPFRHALKKASEMGIPLWAISIGSCYGITQFAEVTETRREETNFIRNILEDFSVVTTRDSVLHHSLESEGISNQLLPCIAFLSMQHFRNQVISTDSHRGKVLVNVMQNAGHHDYLNLVSPRTWRTTARDLIRHISDSYEVEFLCHSSSEYELAPLIDPNIKANLVVSQNDFINVSKNCIAAVNNRIHATIGLAGLGIPSLTIGTDSRLYSVSEFELPFLSCVNLTTDKLIQQFESLISERTSIKTKMKNKLDQAFVKYNELFEQLK